MLSMTCIQAGSSTRVAWRACRLSSHASGKVVLREGKCQVEGTGYGSPCKWGKKIGHQALWELGSMIMQNWALGLDT